MNIKRYALLGSLLSLLIVCSIHKLKIGPCSPELEVLINK